MKIGLLFYWNNVRSGKVSLPIVPVCFFKNLSGEDFLSPLRCPKVLVLPN